MSDDTLLLVEDHAPFGRQLTRALERRGHTVLLAESVAATHALDLPDTLAGAIVDLNLPDGDGLELIADLAARGPVLVLTGYASIATAVEAMRLGATGYLQKPADADQILAALGAEAPPPEVATPSLARVEWEHIQRVLADCDGNVSEAARRLGLHRRSLQRKLQKLPPRD